MNSICVNQSEVSHWFKAHRPEYVFLVAGTVGGILANSTRPAEFIYDNMMIHGTVVHAALGSSCIYPRNATQPITEDQLLTGPLEPTNEWYAIAKIAGIKLCQAYRRPSGGDVQRGEQIDDSVADVVMHSAFHLPGAHRQRRFCAVQRWMLVFHQRRSPACSRGFIQPDDIAKFVDELWVFGQFERVRNHSGLRRSDVEVKDRQTPEAIDVVLDRAEWDPFLVGDLSPPGRVQTGPDRLSTACHTWSYPSAIATSVK